MLLMSAGGIAANIICDQGGSQIVASWNGLMGVGKYLVGSALMLGSAIWLISEFFEQNGGRGKGGFKVSTFLFHHIIPLAIFILTVGLVLGFLPSSLLGTNFTPPNYCGV